MHNKRITIISWIIALLSVGIALWLLVYFLIPRTHKSPFDFPNSVWECEHNGATITLLVGKDGVTRGYMDKDEERIYLAFSLDSTTRVVVIDTITEEFYGKIDWISSLQTVLNANFQCTETEFTVNGSIKNEREVDFWQTREPISLVFNKVSG